MLTFDTTMLLTADSTLQNIKDGCVMLIDKPTNWTSFDVVRKLQYTLHNKIKIGHGGTLDPLASGLLIVCTGRCTKISGTFQNDNKKYVGTITIGATTPSYDLETAFDQTFCIENISNEMCIDNAKTFLGEITQTPPAHSAVKVGGKPAYLKARKNEDFVIKSRIVTLFQFELPAIQLPNIEFEISCTKGTYIRSLANDFGKKLNNGSHLSRLRRLESGGFNICNAWQIEDLIVLLQNIVSNNESDINANS